MIYVREKRKDGRRWRDDRRDRGDWEYLGEGIEERGGGNEVL